MIFEYDIDELEDALIDGSIMCECCGDVIELDGVCSEGTPSPFLEAGLI